MKKKLKVVLIVLSVFLLAACFKNMNPSERVEDLMNRYVKNDPSIISELNEYISKQDLTDKQKERYKNIIKDEYSTIKFKVKDEKIDGDEARVEVEIEVKDLYKASFNAGEYLKSNRDEFIKDSVFSEEAFIDYRLKMMEETEDTVKYTIYIDLLNVDGIWTVETIDEETLEKIHGIYNYIEDSNSNSDMT